MEHNALDSTDSTESLEDYVSNESNPNATNNNVNPTRLTNGYGSDNINLFSEHYYVPQDDIHSPTNYIFGNYNAANGSITPPLNNSISAVPYNIAVSNNNNNIAAEQTAAEQTTPEETVAVETAVAQTTAAENTAVENQIQNQNNSNLITAATPPPPSTQANVTNNVQSNLSATSTPAVPRNMTTRRSVQSDFNATLLPTVNIRRYVPAQLERNLNERTTNQSNSNNVRTSPRNRQRRQQFNARRRNRRNRHIANNNVRANRRPTRGVRRINSSSITEILRAICQNTAQMSLSMLRMEDLLQSIYNDIMEN